MTIKYFGACFLILSISIASFSLRTFSQNTTNVLSLNSNGLSHDSNPLRNTSSLTKEEELPIVVSVGRPNIWSLEQAHYLLSRMHHRNRELEASPLKALNPNEVNANQIKLLRQIFGIGADYAQVRLPEGEEQGTGEAENQADSKVEIPKAEIKIPDKAFTDPKLNASTELNNYINLQYEIISQQLTLLRDEVGPGERLVFLELPHSIYTANKGADKRLVQVWWNISGLALKPICNSSIGLDKLRSQLSEINDLENSIFKSNFEGKQFLTTTIQTEETKKLIDQPLDCERVISHLETKESEYFLLEVELDKVRSEVENSEQSDSYKLQIKKAIQDTSENILTNRSNIKALLEDLGQEFPVNQNESPLDTNQLIQMVRDSKKSKVNRNSRYVYLQGSGDDGVAGTTTRAVELIPRQSSLILNKTYSSANGLNIFGGMSWLFGLGVKGGYMKQREEYEQYLHQEVYASAFGKGETSFGWTFAPNPGTKRLNPGTRTTFAVLIVPSNAVAVTLDSRSCFFKQEVPQPKNFDAAVNKSDEERKKSGRTCKSGEEFILPIPNGADRQGFYVSNINFVPQQISNTRIVVSVKGKNFSPQIGVMIDGVSLRPSVGIAQPFLDKVNSMDETYQEQHGIAGEVEYVDSEEIVIAFKMPTNYEGTPTIHLIGPGKSVYLNQLPNLRVNGRSTRLIGSAPMFRGIEKQGLTLKISDLKIIDSTTAVERQLIVQGTGFNKQTKLYIDGRPVDIRQLSHVGSSHIFVNGLVANDREEIIVTVENESGNFKGVASTVHRRRPPFSITAVNALGYKNEIMTVKVDGIGMTGLKYLKIDGADIKKAEIISANANQAFLKINKPAEIVAITLENEFGNTARTVIVRP